MADTCARDDNEVWFGATPTLEGALSASSARQAARRGAPSPAAQPPTAQPAQAKRGVWARQLWRPAPAAPGARGWGN